MESHEVDFELSVSQERAGLLADELLGATIKKENWGEAWLEWADPKKAQKIVDNAYSPRYESNKKDFEAPRDIKNRPVTYWRKMGIDALLKILKQGKITAMDYHKEYLDEDDLRALHGYLADFGEYLNNKKDTNYDSEYFERLKSMSNLDLAKQLFPNADNDQLEKVLHSNAGISWRNLMELLDRNIDTDYVKGRHAGGEMKRFSPFMSLAVASARESSVYPTDVLVEFVIPDNTVEVNSVNRAEGEREVLAKTLESDWIARVFTDSDTYRKDFIYNPNTIVGSFARDPINEKVIRQHGGPVEAFIWNVPLSETLPISSVQG